MVDALKLTIDLDNTVTVTSVRLVHLEQYATLKEFFQDFLPRAP